MEYWKSLCSGSVLAYLDIGNEYSQQEPSITAMYLIELCFGNVMQDSNF